MADQRQIGRGGSSSSGGGGYTRTVPKTSRITGRGKAVAGGVAAGSAWSFNKWMQNNDSKRQAQYDSYLKGFQGSAEQRSGMTQNDWVEMQIGKRSNGK